MLRLVCLLFACLLVAGFSSWPGLTASLASSLAAPGGTSSLLPAARIDAAFARLPHRDGRVTTRDGVALFWRALDPADYHLDYAWHPAATGTAALDFDLAFDAPTNRPAAPRGTVVLLHGWMMDGGSLLPWSLALAQAGYRTITIDLRNHGRSDHAPTGYGTRESDDVVDVVAALRARGEIVGPLHLLGVSYGAATAIFSAADPRLQAESVVAFESFDNAGAAIRAMVPHLLSEDADNWTARIAQRWMRWRMDPALLDAAIAQAGDALGLQLDDIDVGAALAHVPACVLLVHGDADQHVPVIQGRALAAAAPQARYLELAGEDHLSLPMRLDLLAPVVTDWFDRTQTSTSCPQSALALR